MQPHIVVVHDVGGEASALYVDWKLHRVTDDTYLIWEDVMELLGYNTYTRDLWRGEERKDWDQVPENLQDIL